MKKLMIGFFVVTMVFGFGVHAKAAEESTRVIEEIQLENGITKEIIIEENDLGIATRATSTKSGSKTVNYKNGSTILWSVTIHGTFSYNGSSATCTNAYVTTTCPASSWKIISQSASKSGASAIGKVVAKRYALGIAVETVNDDVKLTCSKTGLLS